MGQIFGTKDQLWKMGNLDQNNVQNEAEHPLIQEDLLYNIYYYLRVFEDKLAYALTSPRILWNLRRNENIRKEFEMKLSKSGLNNFFELYARLVAPIRINFKNSEHGSEESLVVAHDEITRSELEGGTDGHYSEWTSFVFKAKLSEEPRWYNITHHHREHVKEYRSSEKRRSQCYPGVGLIYRLVVSVENKKRYGELPCLGKFKIDGRKNKYWYD